MLHVRDSRDAGLARSFEHERSVASLAFDPKGRRIAAATYGGVAQWFARIADQKPLMLRWAGSHVAVAYSPDGRFLVSAMQESALHGWRLQDSRDMRMGGYPAKPRSLVFLSGGQLLATSGANGAVVWPFGGANGPMGREAAEIGADGTALVTRVAAAPGGHRLVAGLDDGRVWTADLAARGVTPLKAERGAQITALAVSADGREAVWGDEAGDAGTFELQP
jgi:WD40 repeat protein